MGIHPHPNTKHLNSKYKISSSSLLGASYSKKSSNFTHITITLASPWNISKYIWIYIQIYLKYIQIHLSISKYIWIYQNWIYQNIYPRQQITYLSPVGVMTLLLWKLVNYFWLRVLKDTRACQNMPLDVTTWHIPKHFHITVAQQKINKSKLFSAFCMCITWGA